MTAEFYQMTFHRVFSSIAMDCETEFSYTITMSKGEGGKSCISDNEYVCSEFRAWVSGGSREASAEHLLPASARQETGWTEYYANVQAVRLGVSGTDSGPLLVPGQCHRNGFYWSLDRRQQLWKLSKSSWEMGKQEVLLH